MPFWSAVIGLVIVLPHYAVGLPTAYEVTDVGLLRFGTYSCVSTLSGSGLEAAGTGDMVTPYMAFVSGGGELIPLGTLGGAYSWVNRMNNVGQVVGSSSTMDYTHAFLWEAGEMTDLGVLGSLNSYGNGINNLGHIVGYSPIENTSNHAFLWKPDTGMVDLGTLPHGFSSEANAITDSAYVVGTSSVDDSLFDCPYNFPYQHLANHATVWLPGGGTVNLGTLDYTLAPEVFLSVSSSATDANEFGDIVGWSETGDCDLPDTHAVRWVDTVILDLGTLGSGYSSAYAVNGAGIVVGESDTFLGRRHAFVWDPATAEIVDLNTLVNLEPGWFVAQAFDINDAGQIAAVVVPDDESTKRGVILTPEDFLLFTPVPGRAGAINTLRVTNATSGATVQLFESLEKGETEVPGCPGTLLVLGSAEQVAEGTADGVGRAALRVSVPGGLSGPVVLFQAVELGACRLTNFVTHAFPE